MLTPNSRLPGEAVLRYLDADFELIERGDFVVCAVTAKKIPLHMLRYWSVDAQEAYFDAAAANQAMVPDRATET